MTRKDATYRDLVKIFKSWQVCDWFAKWIIMLRFMNLRWQRVFRRSNVGLVIVVKLRVFHLGLWCHRSSESWHSHCSRAAAGQLCLVPMFVTMEYGREMQASYTLPCILGERCLGVRTGKGFLNFPQATQHLAAMAVSQLSPKHSMSPR